MRAKEIVQIGKPHLYLDQDGVQADFFGEWANLHRVPSYKHIHDPERAINQLAAGTDKEVYDFFRNLPPLAGGQKIIQWLRYHKIPFTVLSAPLRGNHGPSIRGKLDWLDEHNPGASRTAIFTGEKYKYAVTDGKPNVLVDDYGRYLKAWQAAGGIPIKHEDENTDHTIRELEKIYFPNRVR